MRPLISHHLLTLHLIVRAGDVEVGVGYIKKLFTVRLPFLWERNWGPRSHSYIREELSEGEGAEPVSRLPAWCSFRSARSLW